MITFSCTKTILKLKSGNSTALNCCFNRSILASTMITPIYTKPIDSIEDMLNSPSLLALGEEAGYIFLLKIDPRPRYNQLYNIHVPVPFSGGDITEDTKMG